ncbi:hypothetical protein RHSIM_Rhsim07G0240000 [Rhododendron simsii]|uniref:Uncharacterized protein n=1 Tax=Rhododendron simsii TaxID=118357 RepID=A0A834GRB5_RHOSS|nr:hypothetical protein RHSIM_Rhsim07G0240000 [Rhododendron simsii]
MANLPPPPPPPSPDKKFACMFVIGEYTRKLEWYAFEISDDPKHNQPLPPPLPPPYTMFSHDGFSHLLPFHDDDDDEPARATALDPIATAARQEDDDDRATGYVILFGGQPKVGPSLYHICASVDGMKLGDDSSVEPIIELIGGGGGGGVRDSDASMDYSAAAAAMPNRVPSSSCARACLFLGDKLYYYDFQKEESTVEEEEAQASGAFMAYDPKLNAWKSLPDPLHKWTCSSGIFSAATEDASDGPCIVVGSGTKGLLQIYFVESKTWKEIEFCVGDIFTPNELEVIFEGPTVAVGNKLYWYVLAEFYQEFQQCLIQYDFVEKTWFRGSLQLHDHEGYLKEEFSIYEDSGPRHFRPRLAHLGGDLFCLFWVSMLGNSSRLHCMKFQVITSNDSPDKKGFFPLEVSILSCQSYVVSGVKRFVDSVVV